MKFKSAAAVSGVFALYLSIVPCARAGEAVSRIQKNGFVRCGVNADTNAYAYQTSDKKWKGIDVELCRLTAAAVLGDADRIKPVAVSDSNGFAKLNAGEIDILTAATPWTLQTDTLYGASFPAVFYHSSFGFLGKQNAAAESMKAYEGQRVCVSAQSPFVVKSLTDYNKKYDLKLRVMKMPDLRRAKQFYYLKRCELLFDRTEVLRSNFFDDAPETIGRTPLPEVVRPYATGIFVKNTDRELESLVRWSVYAVMTAERKGVTSQNTEDFENTQDVAVASLLANETAVSNKLGVPDGFMRRVIADVGNYGEIFERALGSRSVLKMTREKTNRQPVEKATIWSPDFNE